MSGAAKREGLHWESLARAAAGRGGGEERAALRELLAFTLDGDRYALPVERVREIVRMRPVTTVPRVPPEVRGVISLRGEIVEVLDLRLRVGLPPVEPTRGTRIIVLHGDDEVTGLLVDGVTEVLRVAEEAIQAPPAGESEYVAALFDRGGEFVSLIHLERVLDVGGR